MLNTKKNEKVIFRIGKRVDEWGFTLNDSRVLASSSITRRFSSAVRFVLLFSELIAFVTALDDLRLIIVLIVEYCINIYNSIFEKWNYLALTAAEPPFVLPPFFSNPFTWLSNASSRLLGALVKSGISLLSIPDDYSFLLLLDTIINGENDQI